MRTRRVIAGGLGGLAMAATVAAQAPPRPRLDLGPPPAALPAGKGAGAIALAVELQAAAERLSPEARPAPDASARARAGVRRLAAELLQRGEALGEAGAQRLLVGRVLAHRAAALDEAVARVGERSDEVARATLAALVEDLDRARVAVGELPADGEAWRAARDGLAMLTPREGAADGAWGWVVDGELGAVDLAALRELLARTPGVDAGGAEGAAEMEPLLAALAAGAESGPVGARAAALTAGAVRAVAASVAPRPAWITEAQAGRVGRGLLEAAARAAEPGGRAEAADRLERWRRWAALGPMADAVGAEAARANVRAAVVVLMPEGAAPSAARLAEAARTLRRIGPREGDERGVPRTLRSAVRSAVAAARAAEAGVLPVLARALGPEGEPADPAVLAPLAAHRAAVEDVARLRRFAELVADFGGGGTAREVEVAPAWARTADRAQRLAQDLVKPDRAVAAREELRTLLDEALRIGSVRGEAALRDAAGRALSDPRRAAWDTATGGRTAALARELQARREAWMAAARRGQTLGEPDRLRLEAVVAVTPLIDDAVAVLAAGGAAGGGTGDVRSLLDSWPGVELSAAALARLTEGLGARTAEAARLAAEGDAGGALEAAKRLREDYAPVVLLARLARGHAAATAGRARAEGPTLAVLKAASGAPWPGRSWMGDSAEPLAALCRAAEEWAAHRGGKAEGEEIARVTRSAARSVLAAMDAEGAGTDR